MANKKETNKTIIIATLLFVLGCILGGIAFKNLTPSCVTCDIDREKYEQRIEELNIVKGQALEIIEYNNMLIDSLEVIAINNKKAISSREEQIDSLEDNRKKLKDFNDELLKQTIRRINTSPSHLDSLRRKHFGG